MIPWLTRPYPINAGLRSTLHAALLGGVFVTLFLFVFRPFGMNLGSLSNWMFFWICVQYGLVTAVVAILWGGVIYLLPGIFEEINWQVWKEILANLCFVSCIAVANMAYTFWAYDNGNFSWAMLWGWEKITFLIGIFPIMLGVFLKQMRLTNQYTNEADVINAQLSHPSAISTSVPDITFYGDNQHEMIQLNAQAILYAEAADNYVTIVYHETEQTKQKVLRTTMKKIEDTLSAYPNYFRCHRAYIVNLNAVEHISGNAQGYKLQIQYSDTSIPVSRAQNETIKKKFAIIKN